MIVLGIETSSRIGSVALVDEGAALASYSFPEGARHARNIMGGIETVMSEASVSKTDVDAVAVSQGPGGFTGLRIGVTCAKTLSYVLGWRVVGVPSLEVQVQNVSPRPGQIVCPVQDARRQAVYGTIFEWRGEAWADTSGVLLFAPDELAERIPDGSFVFGSGVVAYPRIFSTPRFEVGDAALAEPTATAVAALGLRMLRDGVESNPMSLVPLYYRPTAAEENLKRR